MPLNEAEKIAHLRLVRSKSVGPVTFRKLLEKYGSAINAVDALLDGPKSENIASAAQATRELAIAHKLGATALFIGDANYPDMLAQTDGAPPVIYIRGNIGLLTRPSIAIVGARNASASGIKLTRIIAAALGEHGIVITSGLARGIDTAAHNAATKSGTIACLAGGIDVIYPPENRELYHTIAKAGLLISEMPPGTEPQARHFPRRNRIISGMASGVVVIEAAAKSGSLITARFAADQGRDIYAVPGSPLDPRSAGANQLIKDGAVLVRNAEDILEELSVFNNAVQMRRDTPTTRDNQIMTYTAKPVETTDDLTTLLSTLPIHIDELVRISGQPANDVLVALQLLELEGKITRHTGSRFSRNQ